MVAFIQRAAGYCLTGLVNEEVLLFLYGPGGNGKGTVIETLLWVMGDYGVTVLINMLFDTHNTEHQTEMAKLWVCDRPLRANLKKAIKRLPLCGGVGYSPLHGLCHLGPAVLRRQFFLP
jgi:hypothetical protein